MAKSYSQKSYTLADSAKRFLSDLKAAGLFLRFPDYREKAFRHYYFKHTLFQFQTALIFASFLYISVDLLDPYTVPGIIHIVRNLRHFVVVPTLLASVIITYTARKEAVMQIMGSISIIVACGAISIMMALDKGLGSMIFGSGLIIALMYGGTCLRLRLSYVAVSGMIALLTYIVTGYFIRRMSFSVLFSNSYFTFLAYCICLFTSYILEISMRREYLYRIEMKKNQRQLQRMSLFDHVTGIPNRRMLNMRLSEDFTELHKTGQPLSMILADIDYFKDYNDHYGHLEGDRCLAMVAGHIHIFSTRTGNFVARFGGEEFAMILSNTSLAEAQLMAEKIRQSVRGLKIRHPKSSIDQYITISLGVASITPDDSNSFETLINLADSALYRAKNNGRNRVEVMR